MRMAVTPYGQRPMLLDWPNDWRVPACGELLLLESGSYVVDSIQWELEDHLNPAVHLRVAPC